MEILIVGVVLVALMVYVSTRIKKSAASAFEQEIIEKENFKLIKPDGFISPIHENSDFAFEAYTKEFGKNEADEFRQAQARLVVISDSSFETVVENIIKTYEKVLAKNFPANSTDEQKICLIESEKIENNITLKVFYKIIESRQNRKVYNLKVSILDAYLAEYRTKINDMLESFVVE
jgi:ribosomal protein S17E